MLVVYLLGQPRFEHCFSGNLFYSTSCTPAHCTQFFSVLASAFKSLTIFYGNRNRNGNSKVVEVFGEKLLIIWFEHHLRNLLLIGMALVLCLVILFFALDCFLCFRCTFLALFTAGRRPAFAGSENPHPSANGNLSAGFSRGFGTAELGKGPNGAYENPSGGLTLI